MAQGRWFNGQQLTISWYGLREQPGATMEEAEGRQDPRILIRALPRELYSEEMVIAHFAVTAHVNVLRVSLRSSRHRPPNRTALVTFANMEDAKKAMQRGSWYNEQQLNLTWFGSRDQAHIDSSSTQNNPWNFSAQVEQPTNRNAEAPRTGRSVHGQEADMVWYGPSQQQQTAIAPSQRAADLFPAEHEEHILHAEHEGPMLHADHEGSRTTGQSAQQANMVKKLEEKEMEMAELQRKIKALEEKKARRKGIKRKGPGAQAKPIPPKSKPIVSKGKINIENAERLVGTCPTMCPEKEMELRVLERDVSVFERLPGDLYDINPDRAVKKYRRSAALSERPDPSEVRPSPVLSKTMNFLLEISDDTSHSFDVVHGFIRDRTRSIRQDFTYQGITDDACVRIHEQSVRFHIMSEHRLYGISPELFSSNQNLEQLDKCLISLRQMYAECREIGVPTSENEAEMQAYYLLFHTYHPETCVQVYSELPRHVFKSREVQFALKITKMVSTKHVNYAGYFNAVMEAPYLVACLMHRNFARIRDHAIKAMGSAYSPSSTTPGTMPLRDLEKLLASKTPPMLQVFVGTTTCPSSMVQNAARFSCYLLATSSMLRPRRVFG